MFEIRYDTSITIDEMTFNTSHLVGIVDTEYEAKTIINECLSQGDDTPYYIVKVKED